MIHVVNNYGAGRQEYVVRIWAGRRLHPC